MENVVAFQRGEGRLSEKYRCMNQIYYNNLEDVPVFWRRCLCTNWWKKKTSRAETRSALVHKGISLAIYCDIGNLSFPRKGCLKYSSRVLLSPGKFISLSSRILCSTGKRQHANWDLAHLFEARCFGWRDSITLPVCLIPSPLPIFESKKNKNNFIWKSLPNMTKSPVLNIAMKDKTLNT